MLDSQLRDFFRQPVQTYHRQYEALRAVFVEQQKQKQVAQQFGYDYDAFRQLVAQFRRMSEAQRQAFFFAAPKSGRPGKSHGANKPLSPIAGN